MNPTFGPACLLIFIVGFTLYGASTLLPLLLQSFFGYDATLAGLVLSPGGLAVIILMPIVGKLVNKIQVRFLIAFGMMLTAFGMAMTMLFTPQTDYHVFVCMRILQVAGLPFLFVPVSTMAFSSIPKEKSGKASALYSLMRNLGGSFGISILLSYLSRHEQMHQVMLSRHLSAASVGYQPALDQAAATIASLGQTHAAAAHTALGQMYRQLLTQSAFLSYGDAYQLLALILAIFAVMALFLPANKLHKKAPDEAVAAH